MTVHPFSSECPLGNPRAAFPTPFSLCARAIGISKFVTCRSARTLDLKVPGVTKQTRVLGIDSDMERAEFNSKTVSDTFILTCGPFKQRSNLFDVNCSAESDLSFCQIKLTLFNIIYKRLIW